MLRIVTVTIAVAMCAAGAGAEQPYAGLERRDVKALSAERVADLRAGRGMGYALAAELNGYPGPVHVLQLADGLGLTRQQHIAVEALFAQMQAEAVALGERLIGQETALDRLFAERRATPAAIAAATASIGATEGELRATHLRYHLSTLALLEPAQVHRYAELRGYAGRSGGHRHKH